MLRQIISISILAGGAATMWGASAEAVSKAVENVERSMDITDATWRKTMRGSATNRYMTDTYNTAIGTTGGTSDVWPYTAAIEAHCSVLEALEKLKNDAPQLYADNHDRYVSRLNELIDNLEYYRGTYRLSSYATSNRERSPYAVPRASQRGNADVSGILNVYDDQMWIARELIRAYRLTQNADYLDLATYLTDYVLEGWDCWRDANGKEYGGITWGPGYNSKHSCSNGPIIQPLVWLAKIYADTDATMDYYYRSETNALVHETRLRSELYLEFARKVYDWQKENLLHSSGVYWDMMGADNTIQVSRGYRQHVDCGGPTGSFFSYNTGTMISGASELYAVTGDAVLLDDIARTTRAAMSTFAKYVRAHATYEFTTDETAESGFNTWFNDVLMRSFVDASAYESTYTRRGLSGFQTNLDYAYDNYQRDSLLPIHLLDGWGDEKVTKGFHQFAFASEYAMLAVWTIDADERAAIGTVVADAEATDDTVYNLMGVRLGSLKEIADGLQRGIYIVGNKKMILGK